ncbi:DUF6119 family protein [Rhodococcoides yunnanense]|uniref:DUF6119 family protein n=1 Tax=Rhodococcoides yunnanense TaxID=278209 RepID=UPI000934DBD7|nr:DUF6119 family protein [Rhodococcus yunnanensis]
MVSSRPFSIYLLKDGWDASNALRPDTVLEEVDDDAATLPENAALFVLDSPPRPPWWKSYFAIDADLTQSLKGAILFLEVDERVFAITFGHVAHNLEDASYEYDFGLRTSMNALDPDKIKNTDVLEPGSARRQRTQLSVDSDIALFDFDRDATILKSLTGKVRSDLKDLIKHATGSANLKISSAVKPPDLPDLCASVYELYCGDQYKESFPEIQNIAPIKDPTLIGKLDKVLIDQMRAKSTDIELSIPEMIDYASNTYISFTGVGLSKVYDDLSLVSYLQYLQENKFSIDKIVVADLKHQTVHMVDQEGGSNWGRFSVYKTILFDASLPRDTYAYHLMEGDWYRIEADYLKKLRDYLDPICTSAPLPDCDKHREDEYNEMAAESDADLLCLDKTNISIRKQAQVEPCDLFRVDGDRAVLYHIKISTRSSSLSHLFNQGANSVELLRSEGKAREKLIEILEGKSDGRALGFVDPVNRKSFKVVFGIITRKDPSGMSRNLPLFSRISLMRNVKYLRLMDAEVELHFIPDVSVTRAPKVKPKKPRKSKVSS